MEIQKIEAIPLRSIPYGESGRILTVFSQEEGILTFMLRGISIKTPSILPLVSSFCVAEILYKKGRGDLCFLESGSSIESFLELGKKYAFLQSAGDLANCLLRSQLPGKKAPALYQLQKCYLRKIPLFADPKTLALSFRLKLLIHDGLIGLKHLCSYCDLKPSLSLHQGEAFCKEHSPSSSHLFSEEDWKILWQLAFSKSFSELQKLLPSPVTEKKIHRIFEESINN